MNTSDSGTGQQADRQDSQADFQHLKEDVSDVLGGARQQADAQFGEYRDSAADQIDALARGAKSVVSEIEGGDTLGMADYLTDIADNMSGLAGKLRNKSAEQLLHDGADLARNNPALFIAGSIALGFGLSRFLKAGTAALAPGASDPGMGSSVPPAGGFGAQRPYETSVPDYTTSSAMANGTTAAAPEGHDHPSDFASTSTPGSTPYKGAL